MQNVNELYHYGVLGMRWGVRRYRNSYGALTKAGSQQTKKIEKEYNELANVKTLTKKGAQRKEKLASEYKELTGRSIKSVGASTKKPNVSTSDDLKRVEDMSNEELQAYNIRKQLENTYLSNQSRTGKPSSSQNKRVQDMTNDELQSYNTRKQLENTYLNLAPKKEVSKGKKFTETVTQKVLVPVAIDVGKKYLTGKVTNVLGIDNKEKDKK